MQYPYLYTEEQCGCREGKLWHQDRGLIDLTLDSGLKGWGLLAGTRA